MVEDVAKTDGNYGRCGFPLVLRNEEIEPQNHGFLGALGALGAPATHLTAQGQALGTDLQIMQMDLEASWPP